MPVRRHAKRASTIVAGAVVLIVCPRRSPAYRPFIATDAAGADVGEIEIELGYAGFREDHDRVTIVAPTFVGNVGIFPNVEAVGELKLANALTPGQGEDPTRVEDCAVSLKWVL